MSVIYFTPGEKLKSFLRRQVITLVTKLFVKHFVPLILFLSSESEQWFLRFPGEKNWSDVFAFVPESLSLFCSISLCLESLDLERKHRLIQTNALLCSLHSVGGHWGWEREREKMNKIRKFKKGMQFKYPSFSDIHLAVWTQQWNNYLS